MDQILYNGRLVSQNQPLFFATNRSFRYGDGLFETMRYHNGRVWWLNDHLARLQRGMTFLGFDNSTPFSPDKLYNDLQVLHPPATARLRLTIFRTGAGAYGPETDNYDYILEASPLNDGQYSIPEAGLICDWFEDVRISRDALSQHKTANALPYVLAARYANNHQLDDVILLNDLDHIAEASSSNLFVLQGKLLITPPLSEGCLDGIMRKQVLDIGKNLGYTVKEIPLPKTILSQVENIWLTNSIKGIRWVRKLGDKAYLPGPLRTFVQSLNQAVLEHEKDINR